MGQYFAHKSGQMLQRTPCCRHILSMAQLVRYEILVKRKSVLLDNACEYAGCLLRSSDRQPFAPLDQQGVGKILIDRAILHEIVDGSERQPGSFHRCRRGRDPSRPLSEKPLRISIGESYWTHSGTGQLQEDRVFADYFEKVLVREALLVIAQQPRRIHAG